LHSGGKKHSLEMKMGGGSENSFPRVHKSPSLQRYSTFNENYLEKPTHFDYTHSTIYARGVFCMDRYEDSVWRKEMSISFDFNHSMADYAAESRAAVRSQLRKVARTLEGNPACYVHRTIEKLSTPPGRLLKRNFVEKKELDSLSDRLSEAAQRLEAARGDVDKDWGRYWMELPTKQKDVVARIQEVAADIRKRFDTFVVLGIGGSALGPIAVQQALNDLHYNELPREKRGAPKLYVEDNVDPERMVSLLNMIDLENTCFNVISKSGDTSETMSQFMIISDLLKQRFGPKFKDHIVVTTDAEKGNLRRIVQAENLTSFVVPDGVGGRFSELSAVGLLAAAVTGIDIEELLAGAADMDARTRSDKYTENPALFAAGLMFTAMTKKKLNVSVMMPYADSLKYFADWYAQLWAESLGKNRRYGKPTCDCSLPDEESDGSDKLNPTRRDDQADPDNDESRFAVGQTPVKALGVTDQHSQVQLYTEGPDDKIITFLAVKNYRSTITIPSVSKEFSGVRFLSGHTLNELIDAERQATEYALLKSAKPSWTITLPEVNAYTIGQLICFFEMMTAYTGDLLEINTFDQPGVEDGKNATYGLLGRPDQLEKVAEMNALMPPKEEYTL
jgi:glucose-6-phosphate isomerase